VQASHAVIARKPRVARRGVYLPTPNDSAVVIYIHCIKADVNMKL